MTYEETLNYIHSVSWLGSRPGIRRIEKLMSLLGDVQRELTVIHVAGTNGKGSFCSMLSSVLNCAHYSVGMFTSPYVKHFNERIQLDGKMISNDDLARVTSYVRPFADSMEDHPTEFELICAVGFTYFAEKRPDFVILEAGLGGRLDSTNVISSPALSVITGIALDHTAVLGDTVEKIAAEKAGIIKEDCPVLFGSGETSARCVIERRAAETNSPFYTVAYEKLGEAKYSADGTDFTFDGEKYSLSLLGEYQTRNAAAVLSAVEILRKRGVAIPAEAVRKGLASAVWPARFELLSKNPMAVYDGAHNPEGIAAAVRNIKLFFKDTPPVAVVGVMADKDHAAMVKDISSVVRRVCCVTPDNARAMDSESLASEFRLAGATAEAFDTVFDGVRAAFSYANAENAPVIILGSLYMYAEAEAAVKKLLQDKTDA